MMKEIFIILPQLKSVKIINTPADVLNLLKNKSSNLKHKVIVRLAGGLGNQLFQFCAGLYLIKRLNLNFDSLCLDPRFLNSYESKRDFEIGFLIKFFPGVFVGKPQSRLAQLASHLRLARLINKWVIKFGLIRTIPNLKLNFSGLPNWALLDGYFQNPEILLSEESRLFIRDMIFSERRSLFEKITQNKDPVAIHIRRGDYITNGSASQIFRTLPDSYYEGAIKRFSSDRLYLIFSDDYEFADKLAKKINGINVNVLNLSLADEFSLLAYCKDYIIANSTFSWWAAYLGYDSTKRVISPLNWYNSSQKNINNSLLMPYFEFIDV
jgi:hypothetical protein